MEALLTIAVQINRRTEPAQRCSFKLSPTMFTCPSHIITDRINRPDDLDFLTSCFISNFSVSIDRMRLCLSLLVYFFLIYI